MDERSLKWKLVKYWGKYYSILIPQSTEEFIYGLENNLLQIGDNTLIEFEENDLLSEKSLLIRRN